MAKIHIGNKIKGVVESSGMSAVEFARKINRSRDVAYKIYGRQTIDTGQLQQISLVLEHDFFSYYSNELPIVKEPGKVGYTRKSDLIASLGDELKTMKKRMEEIEEKYETVLKLARLQEEKLKKYEKKKGSK